MNDRIQEGVHFRPGEKPLPHFSIAFISLADQSSANEALTHLQWLWQLLRDLKAGIVPDLTGSTQDGGGLQVLLGFGHSIFGKLGVSERKPAELKGFREPLANGGGVVILGSGLNYAKDVRSNPANSDIVFQFTGSSVLTVNRAIVEIWKFIHDLNAVNNKTIFQISGAFSGFGREDKRSWIDFFDGTANLHSDQRLDAIEIKSRLHPAPDSWKEHGTYLCFMRLAVDIRAWRLLTRVQ